MVWYVKGIVIITIMENVQQVENIMSGVEPTSRH
jgi:hypothetical protein